jgi:hypothetical protein
LHDLTSLGTNVRRAARSAVDLLRLSPVATLAGLVAVVAGFLSSVVRPLVVRLVAALAVVAALEAAQTVGHRRGDHAARGAVDLARARPPGRAAVA